MNSPTTLSTAKLRIKEAKVCIFDFDGTIANLDGLNVEGFQKMFMSRFGITFTEKDFMEYVSGKGSTDGIKEYLAAYEIFEYEIDELSSIFNNKKRQLLTNRMGSVIYLLPGIEKFLEYVEESKRPMVVATSSRYEYAIRVFLHFGIDKYFKEIIDRDSIVKGKPAPDIFLKAVEATGFAIDECVAFEDSQYGLMSAKAAGLYTVGILNKGWNDEFVYDLADVVVEDYKELI
jgi:HAD superfamily hydrolase (TIGR01509 family)